MKQLIDNSDFVVNPQGLFGDKLPIFYPLDEDTSGYKEMRGAQNYGIFLATQLANKRFTPVINAIKKVVQSRNPQGMDELIEIYNQYKDE